MRIDVCFTPDEYNDTLCEGHSAVVVDVLRATTSMAAAFANGCAKIIPVKSVTEAFVRRAALGGAAVLAGERKGVLIPGFDLGNSPYEYSRQNVAGKTLIMTTTNGTYALHRPKRAAAVYTGAFVNCAAVCEALRRDGRDVVVLCAGTEKTFAGKAEDEIIVERRFSVEDALCAGLITARLDGERSDRAAAAEAMYEGYAAGDFAARVGASSHARHLDAAGFGEDIRFCLRRDVFSVAPAFVNGCIISQE